MNKRRKISLVFFVLLILSILLFVFSKTGLLNTPSSIIAKIASPFQSTSLTAFNFLFSSRDERIKQLEEENKDLIKKIVDQDSLSRENAALHDQFETSSPRSSTLLPAKVVGAPSFIPGITDPTIIIIDKGTDDKVKEGSAIVIKNILVGRVVSSSLYFSKVDLVTHPSFLLTVKDQRSGASGVVKGEGGKQMVLDNVVQSEDIKTGDLIVTKGEQRQNGAGIPPDLILGKVASIDKKPSAVFQKGEIISPLDFSDLSTVFIVVY